MVVSATTVAVVFSIASNFKEMVFNTEQIERKSKHDSDVLPAADIEPVEMFLTSKKQMTTTKMTTTLIVIMN